MIAELLGEGWTVALLSRKGGPAAADPAGVEVIRGDITEGLDIPADVDVLFHCAGVIAGEDRMESVNVGGTRRAVEAALRRGCLLVHLSSAGVVGTPRSRLVDETTPCRPEGLYERTKYAAEEVVTAGVGEGLKARILRPTIVFGAGRDPVRDSFLQLVRAIRQGRYRHVAQGRGVYNIVHGREVARAMIALSGAGVPEGSVFFVNSAITFRDFAKAASRDECAVPPRAIPYPAAFAAALLFSTAAKLTGRKRGLTLSRLRALTSRSVYSQALLERTTGYRPLADVRDYIGETCRVYASRGLL